MPVLHWFVHSLMRKGAQNNSSSGGTDAALEDTRHGGINVALEGVS